MAQINMNSIMDKVKNYVASNDGKSKISKTIKGFRENGQGKLSSGAYIVTLQDMQHMAEELIRTLKEEAAHFDNMLPQSVLNHFDSLTYTAPVPDGVEGRQYKIDIYFQDDLSRLSLKITSGSRKGQRTGDGIANIVSLYDTGYQASNRVYGEWSGHEEAGTIASRRVLEGKYFIERAIESFNLKYGATYNLEAKIAASPEFYSNFSH